MNIIRQHLIQLVLPLLIAPLASWLSKQALNVNKAIDRLPAAAKQAVVFTVSIALTALAGVVPGFLPDGVVDPTLLQADWQAFATWVAALIWHDNKKKAKA